MTDSNSGGVPEVKASGDEQEKQTVAYESYQKVLGEKKAMQAKLNSLIEEQAQAEEARIAEQGDYKQMAEHRERQLRETQAQMETIVAERDSVNKNLHDTWKLQAFYKELPGNVKKTEYLNFVDLDSIVINPDTREVESSSVKAVASDFMANYADLVETKTFKGLPGDAPRGGITKKPLSQMNMKEQKTALRSALGNILNGG